MHIVFEGGEGVGKSTQVRTLGEYMHAQGHEVVYTHEPGGTELGKEIRRLLLESDDMHAKAEALLYAAERAQHVHALVRPSLEQGKVVVQDRYLYSSVAYQGVARGLGVDTIRDLSLWAAGGLEPDVVFLLDIDYETARERMQKRGRGADRIEREAREFHEKVRQGFLDMARDNDRFVVVDASQGVDQVHARVIEQIERMQEETQV